MVVAADEPPSLPVMDSRRRGGRTQGASQRRLDDDLRGRTGTELRGHTGKQQAGDGLHGKQFELPQPRAELTKVHLVERKEQHQGK